jgi:hypothetical protein
VGPSTNFSGNATSNRELTVNLLSASTLCGFFLPPLLAHLRSDPDECGTQPLNGIHRRDRVHVQRVLVGLEVDGPNQALVEFLLESRAQAVSWHRLAVDVVLFTNRQIHA